LPLMPFSPAAAAGAAATDHLRCVPRRRPSAPLRRRCWRRCRGRHRSAAAPPNATPQSSPGTARAGRPHADRPAPHFPQPLVPAAAARRPRPGHSRRPLLLGGHHVVPLAALALACDHALDPAVGRSGQTTAALQDPGIDRGVDRPVHRASRVLGPGSPGPDRPAHRSNRWHHHAHRGNDQAFHGFRT
jgi:hypothetical protein